MPALDPDQLERLPVAQHQLEITALRSIDDAPSLHSTVAHCQCRPDPAVDEHVIAFASEQRTKHAPAVGRVQFPVIVRRDVAEHEHELVGELHRIVRIGHEQRPVEAEPNLGCRHHVRVIPEQASIGHDEVVGERASRFDRRLRGAGHAIHLDGNLDAMPVDGRRLGKPVREVHDQTIALASRINGPGRPPLYVHALVRTPGVISRDEIRASRVTSTIFGSGFISGASTSFKTGVPPFGLQALSVGDSTARHHDDEEKNIEAQTFNRGKSVGRFHD